MVKKAIKPIRNRTVPCLDGTTCTVKLISATCGEETLAGETTFEVVLGNGVLCDALECACSRMRKGEVSLVTVRGPADLHTPGKPDIKIAPESCDTVVVYKLEMVEFAHPGPDEGPNGCTERLRFCTEQKERGSNHLKNGRNRLALERYARVVECLPRYKRESSSSSINVEFFDLEEDRCKARELKKACRLNFAMAALKVEAFYSAVKACDEVLKDDKNNVKALYRRAQGRLGANDFEDAAKDCKRILDIEANNKEARALYQKVKQMEKEEDKRARAQFGGALLGK